MKSLQISFCSSRPQFPGAPPTAHVSHREMAPEKEPPKNLHLERDLSLPNDLACCQSRGQIRSESGTEAALAKKHGLAHTHLLISFCTEAIRSKICQRALEV